MIRMDKVLARDLERIVAAGVLGILDRERARILSQFPELDASTTPPPLRKRLTSKVVFADKVKAPKVTKKPAKRRTTDKEAGPKTLAFVKEKGSVRAADIVSHFGVEEGAARQRLASLVKSGELKARSGLYSVKT